MEQTLILKPKEIRQMIENHFKSKGMVIDKSTLLTEVKTVGYGMRERTENVFKGIELTIISEDNLL